MSFRTAALTAFLLVAPMVAASAQSAAEHVAAGDREHAAMNAAAALQHYEAALAIDSNAYEALWKAARAAISVGEAADEARRREMYAKGLEYARRAAAVQPDHAEGHFQVARALGRHAQSLGARDRVKYAGEVRAHALRALELDPKHAGALHVMGMWNAEIMRLSGMRRMIAKTFLGGKVFGEASWENAVRYMEQAVAAEPDRITHHLDLAGVYADIGEKEKARAEYEFVVRAPAAEPNDDLYKQRAERALREL